MSPLKSAHHALIQALLHRGPLSKKDFGDVFAGVTDKNPVTDRQAFNDALLLINKELAYVQFELRGCMNQYDGEVYYGIVNNVGDESSKLGTRYSAPQIAFYKAVVEAIVQDATIQGFITDIDALNIRLENQGGMIMLFLIRSGILCKYLSHIVGASGHNSSKLLDKICFSYFWVLNLWILQVQIGPSSEDNEQRIPPSIKNFSISQKEKTLSDLIRDRWLCRISDGKIGLGVRSFLDLRSWFRNNEVPPCDVCNEAGVKATACPREDCNIRMHDYCSKKFSSKKVARVCPGCTTPWPEDEHGFVEEENFDEPGEVPLNNISGRKTGKRVAEVEAEGDRGQTESSSGSVMRRHKRVKTENYDAEAGPSQSTAVYPDPPKARRSVRLRPS